MNRIYYLACIFFALLVSCEQQDELIKVPTKADSDTISQVTTPASGEAMANKADIFNIVFSQDFNDNTSGDYDQNEWTNDWNSPEWANHNYGYGKIVDENKNKYLSEIFPAGSFKPAGGYQWFGLFNKGYDELYFSFRIKFSDGFNSNTLQGKLPGLSGGTSNNGGCLPTGNDGWSARYMFHGTEINFYLYYPDIYKLAGDSKPIAGKSYWGMGPILKPGYKLDTEKWYTVTQRVVMNTPGKSDGLVEGFIDGKLCAVQTGIRFRNISSLKIDRVFFANFFGGSGEPPSKTESISFDDFLVFTYKSSVDVARNNVANEKGTTIILPDMLK